MRRPVGGVSASLSGERTPCSVVWGRRGRRCETTAQQNVCAAAAAGRVSNGAHRAAYPVTSLPDYRSPRAAAKALLRDAIELFRKVPLEGRERC